MFGKKEIPIYRLIDKLINTRDLKKRERLYKRLERIGVERETANELSKQMMLEKRYLNFL